MKKFSIITVCLNAPKLELTCESIVNQTFQDFEWIVIDGGSDQETLDIFEKYKYRMDYFVSEKDNGIYDAMNKGIARAAGEWLNFMNAGDRFYANEVLEQVFTYIVQFGGYDVLHGIDLFCGDGTIKSQAFVLDKEISRGFWMNKTIPHQAAFYKKELFTKFGGYDIAFKVCADYHYNVKLFFHNCAFKHIDCIVDYHDNCGISLVNPMNHNERMKIIKEFYSEREIVMNTKKIFSELRTSVLPSMKNNGEGA
jgi:glycosyltransferase involved in cell wall biosynthesis